MRKVLLAALAISLCACAKAELKTQDYSFGTSWDKPELMLSGEIRSGHSESVMDVTMINRGDAPAKVMVESMAGGVDGDVIQQKKMYALDAGHTREISISWGGFMRDLRVMFFPKGQGGDPEAFVVKTDFAAKTQEMKRDRRASSPDEARRHELGKADGAIPDDPGRGGY